MISKLSFKSFLIVGVLLFFLFWMLHSCQKSKVSISNLVQESDSGDEGLEPRPDVIDWIDKHFGHDPKKRMAMVRLAEADQYILAVPDNIEKASELGDIAISCYGLAFGSDEAFIDGEPSYEAVASQTFNTWKRAKARNAYHGRLSGRVFQSYDVQSWEQECAQSLSR